MDLSRSAASDWKSAARLSREALSSEALERERRIVPAV
jgi:hypothetical protein